MQPLHCGHAKPGIQFVARRHYLRAATITAERRERKTDMNLIRNFQNWRRYRETVNELSRLSNRELSDLGITRADIDGIARRGR